MVFTNAQRTATLLVILLLATPLHASSSDDVWTYVGAAVAGTTAVLAAPVVLTAAGFTTAGIAAGSIGASMMSTAAIANGGGVAAGGVVAALQSAGAAGLGLGAKAAIGTAAGAAYNYATRKDCRSDCD